MVYGVDHPWYMGWTIHGLWGVAWMDWLWYNLRRLGEEYCHENQN